MASIIITNQPVSLTAVPGQDSTFTVSASADFTTNRTYSYQWSLSTVSGLIDINGATSANYVIDPLMSDSGKVFVASVSALSAGSFYSSVVSDGASLFVQEDVAPFDKYDLGKETGRERHRRLRHLGYI